MRIKVNSTKYQKKSETFLFLNKKYELKILTTKADIKSEIFW